MVGACDDFVALLEDTDGGYARGQDRDESGYVPQFTPGWRLWSSPCAEAPNSDGVIYEMVKHCLYTVVYKVTP